MSEYLNITAPVLARVFAAVAELYDVSVEQLLSTDRRRQVARARLVTYAALRRAGASLLDIGATIGRDHATVKSGIERIERDAEHNAELDGEIATVTAAARGKPLEPFVGVAWTPEQPSALEQRVADLERIVDMQQRQIERLAKLLGAYERLAA